MRLSSFCAAGAFLVGVIASDGFLAAGPTFRVSVDAGSSHRIDTPVSVEVPLARDEQSSVAVVRAGGETFPAQIEAIEARRARIWWIVDDLAPQKTREYTVAIQSGTASSPTFVWKDSSTGSTKSRDLLLGDRPVLRYMHTPFDGTTKENLELTKKVFHHVFSPLSGQRITKGPGGLYPHHRGIYFGYNRCRFDGQTVDVWHAARGEHQLHEETRSEVAGPVVGGHTLAILWNDREGKPFVEEERTLLAFRQSNGNVLVEFRSKLQPKRERVELGGDRQHAGVQFRAAQEVAENQKQTRFLRPAGWAELAPDRAYNDDKHRNLPWNAIQFRLGDEQFTVAYLADPANPDGADFSERAYGRFGEFFPWELTPDHILSVRYRWWIHASEEGGEAVTREDVEKRYEDLANPPNVELMR